MWAGNDEGKNKGKFSAISRRGKPFSSTAVLSATKFAACGVCLSCVHRHMSI